MRIIRLFNGAGATGHVFYMRKGRTENKGPAYSSFIGLKTIVAVVPTTPQIVDFAIDAQTRDNQGVKVRGSLAASFTPDVAVSKFDFTVDPGNGGYIGNWVPTLKAMVVERVVRVVLEKVSGLSVHEVLRAQKSIEDDVTKELSEKSLLDFGVMIGSCSIPKIGPSDEEVEAAIGAEERQKMLSDADKAMHERRLKAVENDRAVKTYEAGTKLQLEKEQAAILAEQAKNKKTEAETDAAATEIRLAPLRKAEPKELLGAAILEAAKAGRLSTLNVTTELLAVLNQQGPKGG